MGQGHVAADRDGLARVLGRCHGIEKPHRCAHRHSRARAFLRAAGNGSAGRAHERTIASARYLQRCGKQLQIGPGPATRADQFEASPAQPAGTGTLPCTQQHDERPEGPHRRGAVQDRTAQQVRNSSRLFRRRQRTADRRVQEPLRHHAGAARQRAKIRYTVQGRGRPRHGNCARQRPRCLKCRGGRPYQPGAVLCRDERQSKHRQCALEQIQGKFSDRPVRRSKWPDEVGGDQASRSQSSIRR